MSEGLPFEVLDEVYNVMLHNVFHFVAISTFYYDYVLTFRQEVDYIWRREKRSGSYYFFFNRYFAFLGNIAVSILGLSDLPVQSCKRYNTARQMLLVVTQVLISYLLGLRVYALYECSRRILVSIISIAAVLGGLSCWAMLGQKSAPGSLGGGCHIGISKITAVRACSDLIVISEEPLAPLLIMSCQCTGIAAVWEALFVYDSIIFGLTVYKALVSGRGYSSTRTMPPLMTLILRDGALYFAVMALVNLANVLTYYIGGPFFGGSLSTLASNISVTMVSRLMLNLHETAELGIWSISGWTTYDGTGDGGAAETQGTVIELDTFVTESSRRDGFGTTRGSVTPPGLERIDEEEAVGGENRLMERMGWSSSAGPSRTAGRTMRGILI